MNSTTSPHDAMSWTAYARPISINIKELMRPPKDRTVYKKKKMRSVLEMLQMRVRGQRRVTTTDTESIPTLHTLTTRYSHRLTFSACAVADSLSRSNQQQPSSLTNSQQCPAQCQTRSSHAKTNAWFVRCTYILL